jgi:hypothetical protein
LERPGHGEVLAAAMAAQPRLQLESRMIPVATVNASRLRRRARSRRGLRCEQLDGDGAAMATFADRLELLSGGEKQRKEKKETAPVASRLRRRGRGRSGRQQLLGHLHTSSCVPQSRNGARELSGRRQVAAWQRSC